MEHTFQRTGDGWESSSAQFHFRLIRGHISMTSPNTPPSSGSMVGFSSDLPDRALGGKTHKSLRSSLRVDTWCFSFKLAHTKPPAIHPLQFQFLCAGAAFCRASVLGLRLWYVAILRTQVLVSPVYGVAACPVTTVLSWI